MHVLQTAIASSSLKYPLDGNLLDFCFHSIHYKGLAFGNMSFIWNYILSAIKLIYNSCNLPLHLHCGLLIRLTSTNFSSLESSTQVSHSLCLIFVFCIFVFCFYFWIFLYIFHFFDLFCFFLEFICFFWIFVWIFFIIFFCLFWGFVCFFRIFYFEFFDFSILFSGFMCFGIFIFYFHIMF